MHSKQSASKYRTAEDFWVAATIEIYAGLNLSADIFINEDSELSQIS